MKTGTKLILALVLLAAGGYALSTLLERDNVRETEALAQRLGAQGLDTSMPQVRKVERAAAPAPVAARRPEAVAAPVRMANGERVLVPEASEGGPPAAQIPMPSERGGL